ncbi:carboxymuconolactone decarboxylase family protein [Parasedimentitalea maritima]|uniref:Carboxymuconolactone decarboxylase family protein n=1 Tax=Parasedimentitalea maritima TaxID=2578117 RepID=A0A5R8ZRJ5_9RHOB|nr:carboxymuconolactone decarboxylase family protein [Zongyanglinia marina]KAE9632474.1 carboxymuconolactone decarboxylase family protein [Zongyanglinia marina]TLP68982.1 carboxymuconolactone decarboxylase family protein [Zongyanglinia marina]
MSQRLDQYSTAPELIKPLLEMEKALDGTELEFSLKELIKLRASQINGCAYCIHMHTNDARAGGVSEDRLHLLNAWRESSLYSDRERAALAWTETLTRVETQGAPDAHYKTLTEHFTPHEQVAVTLAITAINSWNRLAIAFSTPHPAAQEANAA